MQRPQKISFGEMRASGVRGVLIYCSDFKCSHHIEMSADQWPDEMRLSDLDSEKKTLRIERAWEPTKAHGSRLKPPKTARGLRTIDLDDGTIALLLAEKERYQQIKAGVSEAEAADIDLRLVRLPSDALVFPAVPAPGKDFDFARPRNPWGVSKAFRKRAKQLGFAGFTFHMMRHTHSTMLLDKGMPVHQVAVRIGDDPAILLRVYARLTKKKRLGNADPRTRLKDVPNMCPVPNLFRVCSDR